MTMKPDIATPAGSSAADMIDWWTKRAHGANTSMRATTAVITEVFDHLAHRQNTVVAAIDVRTINADRLASEHDALHWATLAESTRFNYAGRLRRGINDFLKALDPAAERILRTRAGAPANGGSILAVDLPGAGRARVIFHAKPTHADIKHLNRVLAALPTDQ